MIETTQLIDRLLNDLRPVYPLRAPASRAVCWLAMVIAIGIVLIVLIGVRPDLGLQLKSGQFLAELSSALLTGITASFAAFFVSIPGRST